ncbi:hypothetical protein SAMN05443144_104218 [Fodinibius roseus]|uniref:Uncharacterized protein n=1 Tax=Fodinibius roseus TaxID=1194090 RepID=A0A1M4XUL9_9BACT|nr:hypothetical protein SAMN05443144_104218 [Fodinibius roseus]
MEPFTELLSVFRGFCKTVVLPDLYIIAILKSSYINDALQF